MHITQFPIRINNSNEWSTQTQSKFSSSVQKYDFAEDDDPLSLEKDRIRLCGVICEVNTFLTFTGLPLTTILVVIATYVLF